MKSINKVSYRTLFEPPVLVYDPSFHQDSPMTVRSNVHGDSVYIDGDYKGSTRLDLELAPGEYRVKVSKEGYEDWEQSIRPWRPGPARRSGRVWNARETAGRERLRGRCAPNPLRA